MKSLMFPDPARSPLTGPVYVVRPQDTPTTDPAHWWPQHDEPFYREMWAEHREQLLAGLRDGIIIGEVVPA